MLKLGPMEARQLDLLKHNGGTIVHCHGCFDLLHLGHVLHLQAARKMGDVLVVTITSDRFVNKGPGRPVFTAKQRLEMLKALRCVDYAFINDAPDCCQALSIIKPSIYVKGVDYRGLACREFFVAESVGAQVVFTQTEKFSSTALIERVK